MKYNALGGSDLNVSQICLGTENFGQPDYGCDEDTAHNILNAFIIQGGNFIDTADKYGTPRGTSEHIIGNWLKSQKRQNIILSTKCFFGTAFEQGLSRKHIIQSCEDSLKRLNTDYIDLYQAHLPDPMTPFEETMEAFDTLIRAGKVRYIGCSNFSAWQVIKANAIAEKHRHSPFVSGQYRYSLLKREIEAEVIPAYADSGMGILCWSPLSGGLLTGKYAGENAPPKDSRFAQKNVNDEAYNKWQKQAAAIVEKLMEIADKHNQTPATVALSWLLQVKPVAAVIVGAKTPAQIKQNCIAGDWILPEEDWKALESVSRIKHPYPSDIYTYIDHDFDAAWFSHMNLYKNA